MEYFNPSMFSRPELKMLLIKDDTVETFDFTKGYKKLNVFTDLSYYFSALSVTNYKSVIEINNPALCHDSAYIELFESLGVPEGTINGNTDFIIRNGLEKTTLALDNFHISGSSSDTPVGTLSLFVNDELGIYGVYLNNNECFISSLEENEDADIRIVLLDPDSCEVVDIATFVCD